MSRETVWEQWLVKDAERSEVVQSMQQFLGGSMASCTSRHDPSDEEEMLERGRNMKPKGDTDDSSVNAA